MRAPAGKRNYLPDFRAALKGQKDEQLYLIACAPKSGSTYAAALLCEYLGVDDFFAGKVPSHAVQDLDEVWIDDAIKEGGRVIHQHAPYHHATQAYIDAYNIRPVILVRDLTDTIPSIRDHLKFVGKGTWPNAHITKALLKKSDDRIDLAIAHLIMPWYFTFYAGWHSSGYQIITYDQLMADPKTLLNALEIDIDSKKLAAAIEKVKSKPTRLNHGKSGRGKTLRGDVLRHIREMSKHYNINLDPILPPSE